ncbi:glycosyltransferase family 2 protein [Algoriphagus kandeliae]|uniref:Glycosyltransferase family 2 protein n=1 Tax=Algoriphagus kandeliae TaxID=2562278 RepID=A0A4Y9QKS8_9BACT|nr:glycosyltransferase family 2 protein [Algoriphagus kandeliae]TFV93289.1 glycosyltransferase family 2 protein [Algoriphagus kandeliae]
MSEKEEKVPEISILIPFKNAEKWMEECLDSIVNQSFPDFEVIGVDDFSQDGSVSIYQEFVRKDPRFKMISNVGHGVIPALDLAFSASKGKMITRMDPDDRMPEKRLEIMRNRLLRCDRHTVVTGKVLYFSEHEVSPGNLDYQSWLNDINMHGNQYAQIYRECVIASPNWLTYRENIDLIGGFGSLHYPEDYDLAIKWYERKINFEAVQELTLYWREHPDRSAHNSNYFTQKLFLELKINAFLKLDFRGGPLLIWGKNKKSEIISKILKEHQIHFKIHDTKDFKRIEKISNPQLLVAIYPEEKERIEIQKYLTLIGLKEGTDWWWV